MGNLTLFSVFFQSISEGIILIATSLALLGYNIQDNIKKIILIGTLDGLFLIIVRMYCPFGLHTFIALIFLTITISIVMKIEFIKSFIIGSLGIILIGALECAFVPILLFIFNLPLHSVLENQFLRTFITYPHMIILASIGVLAQKKVWSLIDLNTMLISKKTIILVFLVLLQSFFILFFNIIIVFNQTQLLISIVSQFSLVINVILTVSLVISIILLKKLIYITENEAIMVTQEAYTKNVDDLFVSYRAQRHDFHNHLQTIYNMIHNCKSTEIKEYLDLVIDDFEELNDLIRLKNSAVAALLKAKIAATNSKDINFEIDAQCSLDNMKIKPHELVTILGNLINNAIEAVENSEQKDRQISLELSCFKSFIVFKISTPVLITTLDRSEKIFEQNFTTKNSDKHDGIGLTIVKNLVTKNKGEIDVTSTKKDGTVFSLIFPT